MTLPEVVPEATRARRVAVAGRAALIALPFVFPFAAGPSVNVWQQLASWFCVALLLLVSPSALPSRRVLAWMAMAGAAILLGRASNQTLVLSACTAVAAAGLMAGVGAAWARASFPERSALPAGLLVAGLVSAVLGLLQYHGLADPLVPWTTVPELGQAYGNLRQRNQFASLISMALVAALWLHASCNARVRAMLLPAAVLLVFAAAAATSRTGLLQTLSIGGIAMLLAMHERRQASGESSRHKFPQPWILLALLATYFAASWLLPKLAGTGVDNMLHRLREGAPDAQSRLVLWRNVVELIAAHPWAGWGWGELKFAHYSTLYPGPRFAEILDNAHNLPLHLAVELGVPVAALVCGGFCWLVIDARPWRETDPMRLMAWSLLGIIVLHSLLEYPLWYGPFQLVFGLCLGILWPASVPRLEQHRAGWVSAAALPKTAAIALVAIVAYSGWDYARISQIYLAREARLPAYRDDTLAKLRGSWLFAAPVQFAELTLTPVSTANAAEIHALAQRVLHFSPEPRVIVKLIESATLLGKNDEALAQAERFRIAYPHEYARWVEGRPVDDPSE
jgi:O-antigen ligase